MRRGFGIVLALLAGASTVGFAVVFYQTLSGDFVGGEIAFVWTITAVVGLLTVGLWAGAFGLLSASENRKRAFGYLAVGVLAALILGLVVGFVT